MGGLKIEGQLYTNFSKMHPMAQKDVDHYQVKGTFVPGLYYLMNVFIS